jgi:hypothetical protein
VSNGPASGRSNRRDGPDLSPVQLIRDSLAGLRHPDLFLRLAVMPALGMFIAELLLFWLGFEIKLDLTGATPPSTETVAAVLLNYLVYLVFTTLFSVNWTRSLLLGPAAVPGFGLQWGLRETRYLLRAAAIAFIPAFAGMFVVFIILAVFGQSAITGVAALVLVVIYLFVMVRLTLLLPAAALDHPFTLRAALALRGRLAARLLATQMLVTLPYLLLMVLVGSIVDHLGFFTLAPYASQFVFLVLNFIFFAISAGIFAYAFQAIVNSRSRGALTV